MQLLYRVGFRNGVNIGVRVLFSLGFGIGIFYQVLLQLGVDKLNKCKKNCSLSTTYNGEMTHRKQQK